MLDEHDLFAELEALQPGDPRIFQKIALIKSQTQNKEILMLLDDFQARIAGARLSTWFPRGVGRRLMMVAIALIAVAGAVYVGSLHWLLVLLVIPLFSPPLFSKLVLFIGRLSRG